MIEKELKISIYCPVCGTICESDVDQLPHPNMSADTAWESTDCVNGLLICEKCGKEIEYSISEDMYGGFSCVPSDLKIL